MSRTLDESWYFYATLVRETRKNILRNFMNGSIFKMEMNEIWYDMKAGGRMILRVWMWHYGLGREERV